MRRLSLGLCVLVVSLTAAGSAQAASKHGLDMYTAKADAKSLAVIHSGGYDVAESHLGGGDHVDLVLTAREADRLRARGVDVSLKRNGKGQTVRQQADAMAAGGYQVYRSYDEAGGIRDELYALARRNPAIVKLVVIGRTLQGREIIALKVTKNARQLADGARPATLYMGTIHAREWIATEVTRRLLRHFVENYGQQRRDHEPRQHARAVVHAGREPGRLPVHVHHRAPVAQEPARQQRRRHDHDRRRRRPEPQLRRALELRQRGVLDRVGERHLSRHGARLRAGDPGAPGPHRPDEVQVPPDLPLVRAAAALPVRLAGEDAVVRRPAVRRVHRHGREPGRRRLRPRRGRGPLHDERHDGRLRVLQDRGAELDARAVRGLRRLRLRVPRRRGARAGGVREEPPVRDAARALDA